MPKDATTTETLFATSSFTTISIAELQRLQRHKVSGMTMRVWMILKVHCYGTKKNCFPSLRRIAAMLGFDGENYKQAIGRCLLQLERSGFIQRNQARKQKQANQFRFVLLDEEQHSKDSEAKPSQDSEAKPSGNRIKGNNKKQPPKSPVSPEAPQGTRETKDYKRKWRTPEERRRTKAQRAAARAERQRAQQTERERHCPVETRRRVHSALGDIAFGQPPRGLLEGDAEHLKREIVPWLQTLGKIARTDWFGIDQTGEAAFIERMSEAIENLDSYKQ